MKIKCCKQKGSGFSNLSSIFFDISSIPSFLPRISIICLLPRCLSWEICKNAFAASPLLPVGASTSLKPWKAWFGQGVRPAFSKLVSNELQPPLPLLPLWFSLMSSWLCVTNCITSAAAIDSCLLPMSLPACSAALLLLCYSAAPLAWLASPL